MALLSTSSKHRGKRETLSIEQELALRIFTRGQLSCTLSLMTTIQTNTLTAQQRSEIDILQTICGEKNKLFLSNELNIGQNIPCFFLHYSKRELIGVLIAFFPTSVEVEIQGCVHPSYRGKGVFTTLLEEAKRTYKPYPFLQMLFQVEPSSVSGKAYLEKRFPYIDRSEYRMILSKNHWKEVQNRIGEGGTLVEVTEKILHHYAEVASSLLKEDATSLLHVLANPKRKGYLYRYGNRAIGVLQVCKEKEQHPMIHAVAIDEGYRGQGHGKTMLALALDTLFLSSESVTLEVDSQNPTALSLYHALGFTIDFQVDYHALLLS